MKQAREVIAHDEMKMEINYAVVTVVVLTAILNFAKSQDTDCHFYFVNGIEERDRHVLQEFRFGNLDVVKIEFIPDDFAQWNIAILDRSQRNPFIDQSDIVQYGLTHYFLASNDGIAILGYPNNVEALSLWTLSRVIKSVQFNISVDQECAARKEDMTAELMILLWNEYAKVDPLTSGGNDRICFHNINTTDYKDLEQSPLPFTVPYYTHNTYRKICRSFERENTSWTDTIVEDSCLSKVIMIGAIFIPIIYPLFGLLFPTMLSDPEQKPHLYYARGECPFAPRRLFFQVSKFSVVRGKIIYFLIFLIWLSVLIFCQYLISNCNSLLQDGLLQLDDMQLQSYMLETDYWSTVGQFSYIFIPYAFIICIFSVMKRLYREDERTTFYRKFLILSCKADTSQVEFKKSFPYICFMSVVDTNVFDCLDSYYLWTYSANLYFTRLLSLFSFRVWLVILKRSWDISSDRMLFVKVLFRLLVSPIIFVFNTIGIILQCTLVSNDVYGGKLFVAFVDADLGYSKIRSNKWNIFGLFIWFMVCFGLLYLQYEICVIIVINPTITLFHGFVFTFVGLTHNLDYYAPYILLFAIVLREIASLYRYIQCEHQLILSNIFVCLRDDLPMLVNATNASVEPMRLPVEIYENIRRQVFPVRECLGNVFVRLLPLSFFYAIAFIHIFSFSSDHGSSMSVNVLEYIFVWTFPNYLRALFSGDRIGKGYLKTRVEKAVRKLQEGMIVPDAPSRVVQHERTPLLPRRTNRI